MWWPRRAHTTLRRALVPITVLALLPVAASSAGPVPAGPRLPWSKLVLHARKLFLGATTTIEISQEPRCQLLSQLWNLPGGHVPRLPHAGGQIIRTSTVMPFGRSERTTAWIDAASGAVLQTEKLSTGSKLYWKLRRYGPGGYFEWRKAPANVREEKRSHRHWSKTSTGWHPWHPMPPPGAIVTSSYALLPLLSTARLDRRGSRLTILIPSHGRLVELSFVSGDMIQVPAGFTVHLGGRSRKVHGPLRARRVDGSARWLGDDRSNGPADTGFMGMRGPLVILVQPGTAVPLRVMGRAKGIGRLVVRLKSVTLVSSDAQVDSERRAHASR